MLILLSVGKVVVFQQVCCNIWIFGKKKYGPFSPKVRKPLSSKTLKKKLFCGFPLTCTENAVRLKYGKFFSHYVKIKYIKFL